MSQQNPTIPTATQAQGIDAVVNDLQTHLSFELSWLTEGMGRAYKMQRVRTNGAIEFKPMVYLGTTTQDYYAAVPDNDNTGQSVILVGDGVPTNQQRGFYSRYEYPLSIIFSANLDTINSTLLLTEDFTEHLMDNVRQALVRDLLGKYYQLEIVSETRQFEDVYSEFDVNEGTAKTSKPLLPMTYFRFNCLVSFEESCPSATLDRCTAIINNLTSADLLTCILPTYDFSLAATQAATTGQQQADMITWLCTAVDYSTFFKGVDEYIDLGTDASINFGNTDTFSYSTWVNTQQYTDSAFIANWSANKGVLFGMRSGQLTALLYNFTGADGIFVQSVGTIPLGAKTLVTFSYDGTGVAAGVEFTIDKIVQTNAVTSDSLVGSFVSAEPVRIGAFNSGWFYLGGMANLGIFNTVLTAPNISSIFALGMGNTTAYATTGIVSHYLLDALNPTDEVGTNNGTSVNMDASNIVS